MSKEKKIKAAYETQALQLARANAELEVLRERAEKKEAPAAVAPTPVTVIPAPEPTEAEVFAAKVSETQAEARRLHAVNPLLAAQFIMQNQRTYYGGR